MNPTLYKTFEEAAAQCVTLAGDGAATYSDGMAVETEEEGGWSFVPVDADGGYWIERRDEDGDYMGHHGID